MSRSWTRDTSGFARGGHKPSDLPGTIADREKTEAWLGAYDKSKGWDNGHPLNGTKEWEKGEKGKPTPYKHCDHTGAIDIFTVKGPSGAVIAFGGATGSTIDLSAADIVLDCADVIHTNPKFVKVGPPEWFALNALGKPTCKVIQFDWPDQRAPSMPLKFWQSAFKLLFHALPKGGRVIATCFGGHGRTGTCLACFYAVATKAAANAVMDYIRETHCQSAIESLEQEKYIQRICDERDRAKGKP